MLLAMSESRGLPGMLGSIDCMHWGGRIALQNGIENSPGISMIQPLFWKQFPMRICGFSIGTLACPSLAMILMSYTDRIGLLG